MKKELKQPAKKTVTQKPSEANIKPTESPKPAPPMESVKPAIENTMSIQDARTKLKSDSTLPNERDMAIKVVQNGIMQDTKRQLSNQLRNTMKQKKLNNWDMAYEMGVSYPTLKRLLDEKSKTMTLITLAKAARVLDMDVGVLLR